MNRNIFKIAFTGLALAVLSAPSIVDAQVVQRNTRNGAIAGAIIGGIIGDQNNEAPVSYTHLTLPTIYSV